MRSATEVLAEPNQRCELLIHARHLGGVLVVGVFLDGEFLRVGVVARVDANLLDPAGGFEGGLGFEMDVGDDGHPAVAPAQFADDVLEIGRPSLLER
jgi:hypothetical protein